MDNLKLCGKTHWFDYNTHSLVIENPSFAVTNTYTTWLCCIEKIKKNSSLLNYFVNLMHFITYLLFTRVMYSCTVVEETTRTSAVLCLKKEKANLARDLDTSFMVINGSLHSKHPVTSGALEAVQF